MSDITPDAVSVHQQAASSYDQIAAQHGALESARPFRGFNNLVKKHLIQLAVDATRRRLVDQGRVADGAAVLDLASGRGGDMPKWIYAQSPPLNAKIDLLRAKEAGTLMPVRTYHAFDISAASVDEARRRFHTAVSAAAADPKALPINVRDAEFGVANCFDAEFWTSARRPGFYDIVSVQFAFHYGCSTVEAVCNALRFIADVLAPGGYFIATIVDCEHLSQRRATEGPVFGNSLFEIRFAPHQDIEAAAAKNSADLAAFGVVLPKPPAAGHFPELPLGARYHFLLEGHVDCDEFAVPLDVLCALAQQCCGLELVPEGSYTFADFHARAMADPLRYKLKEKLSADEVELVSMYRTVCFKKAMPST